LELHLEKFSEEMNRQSKIAHKLDRKDVENGALQKQEMRRIQINKLQRNAGFMEEWTQKGIDDWKNNIDKKREREAGQLEFDLT